MSNCVKRKNRTKRITNKDLGKFCAVKELMINRTNTPPTDQFIWQLLKFENRAYGQTVYIISEWAGAINGNVWKLPANRIILEK